MTHARRPEDKPARQYARKAFVPRNKRLRYRLASTMRGVGYFCASAGLLAFGWLQVGAELIDGNRNH